MPRRDRAPRRDKAPARVWHDVTGGGEGYKKKSFRSKYFLTGYYLNFRYLLTVGINGTCVSQNVWIKKNLCWFCFSQFPKNKSSIKILYIGMYLSNFKTLRLVL